MGSVIGHIIDERFLVERDLSDAALGGGFSIFLVKDLRNYGREGLLKISRCMQDDSGFEGPSLNEVSEVIARIGHPNIEEILETGRLSDGRPFALTRLYLAAATLDRLIAHGKRLDLEGIAPLVEQIADALSAAHSKGILHCDLRPGNILIPAGDIGASNITIINFGSAWPIDTRGESLVNVRVGSEALLYAAPEVLVKLGHRSPASDVYSLAVLVYRLLTGRVPYMEQHRASLLERIHSESAKRPTGGRSDLSVNAAEVIMSALRFEPRARPPDMDDFGLRLVRLLRPPRGVPVAQAAAVFPTRIPVPEVPEVPAVESISRPARALRERLELPTTIETDDPVPAARRDWRPPVSERFVAWALIVLLMAGALSIPIGQTLLNPNRAVAVNTVTDHRRAKAAHHRLKYLIEPQTPVARAAAAAGEKVNLAGPVAFVSDTDGDAYVFNEFAAEDGRPSYRLAFRSSAEAGTNESFETGKAFTAAQEVPSQPASKAIWIVWTAVRNSELESICDSANGGLVSDDDDRRRLRHFLERNRDLRVEISTDRSTGQTALDTAADRIVHRVEL